MRSSTTLAQFYYLSFLSKSQKTSSTCTPWVLGLAPPVLKYVTDQYVMLQCRKPDATKGPFFPESMMHFSHCPKNVLKTILKKRFWTCVVFRASLQCPRAGKFKIQSLGQNTAHFLGNGNNTNIFKRIWDLYRDNIACGRPLMICTLGFWQHSTYKVRETKNKQ